MRGITLWQPWASLVALGLKEYETRSWYTNYRGKLLIHSASRSFITLGEATRLWERIREAGGNPPGLKFPYGSIVAIADLTDCLVMSSQSPKLVNENAGEMSIFGVDPVELVVGDWSPGRYAWKLENVQALDQPIPYKGKQGLWIPSGEVEALIENAKRSNPTYINNSDQLKNDAKTTSKHPSGRFATFDKH